jgi:anti-sigma B factor antagonist
MEFSSAVRRHRGHAHLTVAGPFDAFSRWEVTRQVDDAVARGCWDFVVDASGVTFLDAGGLAVLVRLRNTARARGGVLRIAAASPRFRWVCGVAGLDRSLGLAPVATDAAC